MDLIRERAQIYKELLGIEYFYTLAYKNKTSKIKIQFYKNDFSHLIGFHKLTDIESYLGKRSNTIERILKGRIKYNKIKNSKNYNHIDKRLIEFVKIKDVLENENSVFKINTNISKTKIPIDYIITISSDNELNPLEHLILCLKIENQGKNSINCCCVSFLVEDNIDFYINNQLKYTVLKKEKYNKLRDTKETIYLNPILCDCKESL